jgi:hypothetical protein
VGGDNGGEMRNLRILVACEESQAVTAEFRLLGHKAYSCDILPCTGGHTEWHIQGDVIPLLEGEWDMILAFPPCTHLASSGARWFEQKRKDGRQQQGIDFFMKFTDLNCPSVAIENPVGIMSTVYQRPDQIIHPWQFGHGDMKTTCLWLKNLPKLIPTDIVEKEYVTTKGGAKYPKWSYETFLLPPQERAAQRSKTFAGIAKAMANQWGGW